MVAAAVSVAASLAWAVPLVGCKGTSAPASAAEALSRMRTALDHKDAADLFGLLDDPTRAAIEATRHYHQQALATIEDGYPAELRDREKSRFIDAESAQTFLVEYDKRYSMMAELAGRRSTLSERDFVRAAGGWGYTGLRKAWQERKDRASHDLETIQQSANGAGPK
jgi:hypothetical protein